MSLLFFLNEVNIIFKKTILVLIFFYGGIIDTQDRTIKFENSS